MEGVSKVRGIGGTCTVIFTTCTVGVLGLVQA